MAAEDAAAGSFLAPILDTWKNQCKIASITQQYVHDTVRHVKWVRTMLGKDFDIESYAKRGWVPLGKDEEIGSLPIPPLPAAANQLIEMYQTDMDRATFASIMYGGGAMPSSGRLASLLRASNEASLVPMQKAMQRCIAQMARIVIRIMESKLKKDKVFVFGFDRGGKRFDLSASGEDVGGPCDVDVDVDWELSEDKMSREAHGLQLVTGGVLGLTEYLEDYRKVADTEKSRQDIFRSIPVTHPAYKDYYTQKYIEAEEAKRQAVLAERAAKEAKETPPIPQELPVPPAMGPGPMAPPMGPPGGMPPMAPPGELPVPPTDEQLMAMMGT